MKCKYHILIVLLMIFGCSSKEDKHIKVSIPENWITEQVDYNGETAFIRYNEALISFPKDKYQNLVRISIEYKTINANGFPNDSEAVKLWAIEDLIDSSLNKKKQTIFTGTITVPNKRNMLFYTSTADSAKLILSEIKNSIKGYKLEYGIYSDSLWEAYQGFYKR